MKHTLSPKITQAPFSEDKAWEYLQQGRDLTKMAAAWDRNKARHDNALATLAPVSPLTEHEISMLRYKKRSEMVGRCPSAWIRGTANNHEYGKELYCGLEWCPVCGKDHSNSHKRRISSWLPKAQTSKSIGYWVIEFEDKYRGRFHSKAALEQAGKRVTSVLSGQCEITERRARGEMLRAADVAKIKSRWFPVGVRRWHFFGDPPEGVAAADVKTMKYNPHLNVLVKAGYIHPDKVNFIKAMLRAAFNMPGLIVHYSYFDNPGQIYHKVEYCTRPTFLNIDWDPYLAGSLYGFRNMRSWGNWDTERLDPVNGELISNAVWQLDQKTELTGVNIEAVNALGRGIDPNDKNGDLIVWSKPSPISELKAIRALDGGKYVLDLGAGYYQLLPIPSDRLKDLYKINEISEFKIRRDVNSILESINADLEVCFEPDDIVKTNENILDQHLKDHDTFILRLDSWPVGEDLRSHYKRAKDYLEAGMTDPAFLIISPASCEPQIDLDLDLSDLDQDIL
jgi:hypothetical protein